MTGSYLCSQTQLHFFLFLTNYTPAIVQFPSWDTDRPICHTNHKLHFLPRYTQPDTPNKITRWGRVVIPPAKRVDVVAQ